MIGEGEGLTSVRGDRAHQFFLDVQDRITRALGDVDGGPGFLNDEWSRGAGGGGRSRVIEEGPVLEKGGVNVSCVRGEFSPELAHQIPGPGRRFFATGVSLVIHPRSPHAPTVHANFRYLEKGNDNERVAWFGGGADLTPYILQEEDAVHFHQVWKDACDRHAVADYPRFKKWCDEYFFLPHRGEARGIGGIFFDYLGSDREGGRQPDLDDCQAFVQDAADRFLDAYLPILERRKGTAGTDEEREWQLLRRGRYVEFNLIYDRGTVFGLKTGGRTESILMSLPALVRWGYNKVPAPGTYQEALVEALKSPRDWLGIAG